MESVARTRPTGCPPLGSENSTGGQGYFPHVMARRVRAIPRAIGAGIGGPDTPGHDDVEQDTRKPFRTCVHAVGTRRAVTQCADRALPVTIKTHAWHCGLSGPVCCVRRAFPGRDHDHMHRRDRTRYKRIYLQQRSLCLSAWSPIEFISPSRALYLCDRKRDQ